MVYYMELINACTVVSAGSAVGIPAALYIIKDPLTM